jgi:hypothetical protein
MGVRVGSCAGLARGHHCAIIWRRAALKRAIFVSRVGEYLGEYSKKGLILSE